MAKSTEKKTGRPKGSLNKEVRVQTVEPSRCPSCGSTDRDRYYRTTVQEHAGLGPDGRPYARIVRRWTRCQACGQHRVDRTLEGPDDETGAKNPADGREPSARKDTA